MKYYSAVKKNGVIKFIDKWIALEKIILIEVTQIQEDKQCMFSLI